MTLKLDNDTQEIRYEVENGRARITMARPKKHNAINQGLLEELEHALWEADHDIEVHCVILRDEPFGEGMARVGDPEGRLVK